MTATSASVRLIERGFAVLPASVNLQPTASGAWTDTGLQVVLPAAGTYQLDATVRASLAGTLPVNTFVSARLFDVTAGTAITDSEVLVQQINLSSATAVNAGNNVSGPIQVEYAIPGARPILLQGRRSVLRTAGRHSGDRGAKRVPVARDHRQHRGGDHGQRPGIGRDHTPRHRRSGRGRRCGRGDRSRPRQCRCLRGLAPISV